MAIITRKSTFIEDENQLNKILVKKHNPTYLNIYTALQVDEFNTDDSMKEIDFDDIKSENHQSLEYDDEVDENNQRAKKAVTQTENFKKIKR